MDNKLEKGKNFRVEGSLDSDAVSKTSENKRESQKATDQKKSVSEEEVSKRNSTENGNGVSVSNP
jgi:hypothetical protein